MGSYRKPAPPKPVAHRYCVFRHLGPLKHPSGFVLPERVNPVRTHGGELWSFPDLRAAVEAAERLDRDINKAFNVRYTAGWTAT